MTNPLVAAAPEASDHKLIARRVIAILGSLGSVVVGMVFALIWVIAFRPDGWAAAIIVTAVILATLIPLILFAVISSWTFAPSNESRTYLLRWYWALLAIELASVVAIVVIGFVSQPQIWLPITLVAIAAAFTVVAILLGRALRSTPPAQGPLVLGPWSAPKAGAWFWWVVAAIVVVPSGLLLPALRPWESMTGDDSTFESNIYFILVGLAFVAAGLTCTIRSVILTGRAPKNAASKDFVLRQKVSRAIYRSRLGGLSADELEYARRNAVLVRMTIPWQLGYLVLLFTGISFNQIPSIRSGFGVGVWLVLAFAVLVVVSVVIFVRYIVLAGRFLKVNGQPQAIPQPEPEPQPQLQPPTP